MTRRRCWKSRPERIERLKDLHSLPDVGFTTGIVAEDEQYLVVSGEADLACRITRFPKSLFGVNR